MKNTIFMCLFALSFSSCVQFEGSNTYTLYRNSVGANDARIHVATFDADESEKYNRINCNDSAVLRMNQPGTRTRFWCEKGYFEK